MDSRMFSVFNNSGSNNSNTNNNSNNSNSNNNNVNSNNASVAVKQECSMEAAQEEEDRGGGRMAKFGRTSDMSAAALFMNSAAAAGGSTTHHHESELRMLQMAGGSAAAAAALGSLVRSNSILSDGRLGCSPTQSTASDAAALLPPPASTSAASDISHSHHQHQHHQLLSEHLRRSASDSVAASLYDASLAAAAARSAALFGHHSPAYASLQGYPTGLPLAMAGAADEVTRAQLQMQMQVVQQQQQQQHLFTPSQLRELQHQALVLKYIMNGVNVPPELINPIRSSAAGSLTGLSAFAAAAAAAAAAGAPHLANLPWGGYRLGFGANADPEPGRCRRTDGKKWRCSRDVVPDQKYCERHIHRGRHRARKQADAAQQQGTSPGVSATSASASASSGGSSVTLAGSARAPTGIVSTVGQQQQQQQQQQQHQQQQHQHHHQQQSASVGGLRQYSATNSPSASGLSVGSSLTANQYNQMQLHSAKDLRYVSGITRSDLELGAEQMQLFAEASGSSRGIGQDFQSLNQHGGLTMLSSINNSWRTPSIQQSRAPSPSPSQQPLKSCSPSLMQYSSPQIRSLLGQDFNLMSAENNHVSLQSMAQHSQQQHQYSFLGSGYGSVEAVSSVGRESESQPLRHFFDDWPRPKDASTLSWSDVEDEKPNRHSSTTQLSISIPVTSSDFTNPGSPPGKLKLSPLKLSMSRAGEDDIPLGVELGVGMGLGVNDDRHRQHQTNWIPIAWETPVGGPLAEVLQSSTPRASKNSGLNLMTECWEDSPRGSPRVGSSPARDREGAN